MTAEKYTAGTLPQVKRARFNDFLAMHPLRAAERSSGFGLDER